MVTRGTLLPSSLDGWPEYRYDCVACEMDGRPAKQFVPYPPGETPPATLQLPCWAGQLDAKLPFEHVNLHLYRLSGLATPADFE